MKAHFQPPFEIFDLQRGHPPGSDIDSGYACPQLGIAYCNGPPFPTHQAQGDQIFGTNEVEDSLPQFIRKRGVIVFVVVRFLSRIVEDAPESKAAWFHERGKDPVRGVANGGVEERFGVRNTAPLAKMFKVGRG